MHRLRASGLLLALTLVACAGPTPDATSSVGQPATAGSSASASGTPNAGPGRPYDASAVLAAMGASTRPGGVPDQLETESVAAAVADALWSWDGCPWQSLTIGGACGPNACDLDVSGFADGSAGADLYSFTVDPASGAVTLASTDLHGYPIAVEAELDQLAHAAAGDDLDGLAFVSARWLPPPAFGRFWVAYRTGGEEGSPGLDLLLDTATGELVRRREL